MDFKIWYGEQPPTATMTISPTMYIAVDLGALFYIDTSGHIVPFAIGEEVAWGGIGGNIENQTDLAQKFDSKLDVPSEITPKTATKVTYNKCGLITSGAQLEASDIPNLAQTYQAISDRDTAITDILSENNHYPTSKAVYDYGQLIIEQIPEGGLKVPVTITLESTLPTTGQEEGDYYYITNMDVTSPGRTGRAWWLVEDGVGSWQKAVDMYYNPDTTTIQLNTNGQLEIRTEWSDGRYVKLSSASTQTITGGVTFNTEPTFGTAKTSNAVNDGTKFASEAQVWLAAQGGLVTYVGNITIGAAATGGNITHNLNTENIAAVTFINATTDETELFDWSIYSANAISWSIAEAIGADTEYSVIIIGVPD